MFVFPEQKYKLINYNRYSFSSFTCVYIRFIRKKTSVDRLLLEYMSKKLALYSQ